MDEVYLTCIFFAGFHCLKWDFGQLGGAWMTASRSGYIPEIQGLRTIALLMVASFHIWFGKVSGGVDIFLLVSAYLMTRSLTARSEKGLLTRPGSYLLHKFARLLPAAAATITLILVAVFVIYPAAQWSGATGDAVGSLFYFENFRLQHATVDYFNTDHSTASPFQHFWSLSVQGQVFVLFAVLHLIGDLIARGFKLPVRKVLLAIFAVIAVASFAYSVWLTGQYQAWAYFDTGARVWEFAVGSLLALIHPWVRVAAWFRTLASWLGVAAMLACGFVLPVESSFPGWAALWPVSAAVLVIISAGDRTRFGADRLLAHRSLGSIGGYTYALYLTHWPVLVFFLWINEIEQADWLDGLLVLSISALLSFLITRCVERPVSAWLKVTGSIKAPHVSRSGRRNALVVLVSVSVVASAVGVGSNVYRQQVETDTQHVAELRIDSMGANASEDWNYEGDPVPAESTVKTDWVQLGPECAAEDPYPSKYCHQIDPVNGLPEHTIFAIGSSHTVQLNGAILEAVERHPTWTLRTQYAPFCYFTNQEDVEDCVELWAQGKAYISAEKPDMVVLFGTNANELEEVAQPELMEWVRELMELSPNTQFVVMRDSPRLGFNGIDCALQNGFEAEECVYRYKTSTDPSFIRSVEDDGAVWVDLNDDICQDRECHPSHGGVVTFFDEGHITRTYMRTLAQKFTDEIREHVPWWPERVYEEGEYSDRSGNQTGEGGL